MLRKQIKFTCIVLQLLTWRMKELMGNITGVCRIWDKHQFLMPSLNLMPGLKLWVCFWVCAYVCVWCHFWGQPKWCLVNAVGSKGSTDHNGIFRLSHTQESLPVSSSIFFHLLPFCITLFIWSPLSPSPSLDRSFPSLPRSLALPPGHYSVLPLYKRLLFKTLRSDLVPTEAIPLAALCIYHGSLALSRLLTLQFSCLPPSSIFFFPTRPLSHTPTHTLYLSKFLSLTFKTLSVPILVRFNLFTLCSLWSHFIILLKLSK